MSATKYKLREPSLSHNGEAISHTLRPGPETIMKFGAWIGAQLTMLCSINRKLRSGDYKEIGVRFLCSV